jgi:3-oxoacyl-(acyl-carrier-protein) synthase III
MAVENMAVENIAGKNFPPLVWIGSYEVIPDTQISKNEANTDLSFTQKFGDESYQSWLAIEDKIPNNLSFWDDTTTAYFKNKPVRLRGEVTNRGFIASTVWPHDFKLDLKATAKPLAENESLKSLVQFENGGAKSAYESRLLWANNETTKEPPQLAGKAAIGFMLNGAQGDDDEARGGHFAVVTGRMDEKGDYSRWLVNNYYNLASNSEKGIIAGITPMDKYMADVNSGQSYYRPSYMLVAVLKTDKVPADFQAATNESFEHFYANDFVYDHSRNNCAGVSLDTLRNLGWNIPTRGKTSQLKAIGAFIYIAITEQSLTNGRAAYDYFNTETTRLLPAVAFDAIGEDLLMGAEQWNRKLYTDHNPVTPFMQQMGSDIEAIYFVRIPQIPSSRTFGFAPAYSIEQFMKEAPADRTKWKTVPTTPNPLPAELDNQSSQNSRAKDVPSLVPLPVAVVVLLLLGGLMMLWRKLKNRLNAKKHAMQNPLNLRIIATGKALPKQQVSADDLDIQLSKPPGYTLKKSGVATRYFADSAQSQSELGASALQNALQRASISVDSIDLLISACGVQEQALPSTACAIAAHAGLRDGTPAFDVNASCLSFMMALNLAATLLNAHAYKRIAIVSADLPSRGLNWHDPESSLIFGDGAAAAIVELGSKTQVVQAFSFKTYPIGRHFCEIRAGGTRRNPNNGALAGDYLFSMDGKKVLKLALQQMTAFLADLLTQSGINMQSVDLVVPHQASHLGMSHMSKKLGFNQDKIMNIYATHGNQVAASQPTALHEAFMAEKLGAGKRALLLGTAAGVSFGGMVLDL